MSAEPDLSTIASLIGDLTRATMLSALLSGQALPASELAYRAYVTPQTASMHLAKLVDGGLLAVSKTGRHRYYRLKNTEVAQALEALLRISPPPRVKNQRDTTAYQALCFARSCYDHLAGKLGVELTQALVEREWLVLQEEHYVLTQQGSEWLAAWHIDEHHIRQRRRKFAPTCVDWSERRHHVAGALGAAIMTHFLDNNWLKRASGSRALHITETGRLGFKREFGINTQGFKKM